MDKNLEMDATSSDEKQQLVSYAKQTLFNITVSQLKINIQTQCASKD